MRYPTMDEVEAADRVQLCRWVRFLPSPGMHYLDTISDARFSSDDAQMALKHDEGILNRVLARHREAGGFTPEISKQIGWNAQ